MVKKKINLRIDYIIMRKSELKLYKISIYCLMPGGTKQRGLEQLIQAHQERLLQLKKNPIGSSLWGTNSALEGL